MDPSKISQMLVDAFKAPPMTDAERAGFRSLLADKMARDEQRRAPAAQPELPLKAAA